MSTEITPPRRPRRTARAALEAKLASLGTASNAPSAPQPEPGIPDPGRPAEPTAPPAPTPAPPIPVPPPAPVLGRDHPVGQDTPDGQIGQDTPAKQEVRGGDPQARIRELESQLRALTAQLHGAPTSQHGSEAPATPAPRPAPQAVLSQEELAARLRQDQLARAAGAKDPDPQLEPPAHPGAGHNIRIHFLEDGFTALGKQWYRGQELEFEPDSAAYRDTCDRLGSSWLELAGDDFAQMRRWGKVVFRPGPWPGASYRDGAGAFETLKPIGGTGKVTGPAPQELQRAEALEAARRRAAPRLPQR